MGMIQLAFSLSKIVTKHNWKYWDLIFSLRFHSLESMNRRAGNFEILISWIICIFVLSPRFNKFFSPLLQFAKYGLNFYDVPFNIFPFSGSKFGNCIWSYNIDTKKESRNVKRCRHIEFNSILCNWKLTFFSWKKFILKLTIFISLLLSHGVTIIL